MEAFLILAFSLLTPPIVSLIKNSKWPDWGKVLLTLGVSLLGGALTALVSGTFDLDNIAGTGGTIFTLAVTFYKTYFQATGLNQQLTGGLPTAQNAAKSTFTRTGTVQDSSGGAQRGVAKR